MVTKRVHMPSPNHMPMDIDILSYINPYVCLDIALYMYLHTYIYACMHTHIPMYTCIHLPTNPYIYIVLSSFSFITFIIIISFLIIWQAGVRNISLNNNEKYKQTYIHSFNCL